MRTGGGSWPVTGGTHGIDKKGRGKGLLDDVVSDMMFSVEYLTEKPREGWNVEKGRARKMRRGANASMPKDCRWRRSSLLEWKTRNQLESG